MLRCYIILLLSASSAWASSVDDRCSKEDPCTPLPDGSDSLYCDFQIGPTSGGFCAACEGRQTYFCSTDELGLPEAGQTDCQDKCSLKSCPEPCEEGYFCSLFNFQDGPCQKCENLVVHPEDCRLFGFQDDGLKACMETCPPKACSKRRHCLSNDAGVKYFCNFLDENGGVEIGEEPAGTCEQCAGLASIDECASRGSSELAVQECREVCEDALVTPCVNNDDCRERYFCNHNSTVCQACPLSESYIGWHVDHCYNTTEMGLFDFESQRNCASSCHTECRDETEGVISVDDLLEIRKDKNVPMKGTPYMSVSGPLVDCKFGGDTEDDMCPQDAPEGFVCLISRGIRKFSDKALNCEEQGGIATVMYNNEENGNIVEGTVGDAPVEIPITAISLHDGLHLLENGLGKNTTVNLKKTGDDCYVGCSDAIPCPASSYCDYTLTNRGYCQDCKPDENEQRIEVRSHSQLVCLLICCTDVTS